MQSRLITRGFSSIPHNSALFHIAQSARLKKLVPALVSPTLQFEKTDIYQFLIVFMKRRPWHHFASPPCSSLVHADGYPVEEIDCALL
jgi:hypothetical protein